MKINLDNIDDDLIKELIEKCEDRMASPFKDKAKEKAALIEVEPKDDEESHETPDEEKSEDDIDPEMLKKLMESYKNRK